MLSIDDIITASERLKGQVLNTPVLTSPMLDRITEGKLYLKAESLQLTGSFKIRGALNKILSLTKQERAKGILAYSSGNHGHAVAAASKMAGCQSVILLPTTTPAIKIANCRWWGAEIIFYDAETVEREAYALKISQERGMVIIPPFDDYMIMAGQGTVGLELAQHFLSEHVEPDILLINCSGGGLTAGVMTAMRHFFPTVECIFVEPAGFEKMASSVEKGRPQRNPPIGRTILDGIAGPIAGTLTLPQIMQFHPRGVSISEDEALEAMAVAYRTLKLVLEPGGAASLAAILSGKVSMKGKNVAVIGSGGNVDEPVFIRALLKGE